MPLQKLSRCLVAFALVLLPGCSHEQKLERHLKRANAYFAARDFKRAEIEYRNVLRVEPTNSLAAHRIASIYFDRGQFERAVPILFHLRRINPSDDEVRIRLSQFNVYAGELTKGRNEILPLVDGLPEHDEALLLLVDTVASPAELLDAQQRLGALESVAGGRAAWQLAMAGIGLKQTNFVAAERFLQKALALAPQSGRVHFAWADYWWLRKDLRQANAAFERAVKLEGLSSTTGLRWVDFKLRVGSTNEAVSLLQRMAKEAPEFIPGRVYLAQLAFAQRNFVEGSNLVQQVLAEDPFNLDARLMQAEIKRLNGRTAEAIKDLEELNRAYPGSPQLLYQLGVAFLQNRNTQKAAGYLREMLKLRPGFVPAVLALAEINIRLGDTAAAILALQELIRKQPEISQAYFLLTAACTSLNRYADAHAVYYQVESANPTNAIAPFFSGIAFRMENRISDARKTFEKSLSLAPRDPVVTYQLVELDIAERKFSDAQVRVRQLLAGNSKLAIARFLEARIALSQTNLVDAEKALRAAIATDSSFTAAYSLLAQVYLANKETGPAIDRLNELLKQDPRNISALMLLGAIFEEKAEYAGAVEKYRQALRLSPQFAPALNNLAYLLAEKFGKTEDAYVHARKARELAPQDSHIADTLGWIQYQRKEYVPALALLQEASSKLPADPQVQFHLAMACYRMALPEPARDNFKRALASPGRFPGRVEAEERLRFLELSQADSSPATIARLQRILEKDPNDALALLWAGSVEEKAGGIEKARKLYEQAHKASPGSAIVLLRLAEFYFSRLKLPAEALAYAREARKLSPDNAEIGRLLGKIAFEAGDHQWALSLMEERTRDRGSDPDLLFDLARAYFSVGRVDDSQSAARRALQHTPGDARIKAFLSTVEMYRRPEIRRRGDGALREILARTPEELPTLMVEGLMAQEEGKAEQARDFYEKAARRYPLFAEAKKRLALLYAGRLNDPKKAFEYATEARKMLGQDAELALILGRISYRRGEYRNAIRYLREASRTGEGDAESQYMLGLANFRVEEGTEGRPILERALKMDPNSPLAKEAKTYLSAPRKQP